MVRTSIALQATGLDKVGTATTSPFPTIAQHLWDGRTAIRGAIRR